MISSPGKRGPFQRFVRKTLSEKLYRLELFTLEIKKTKTGLNNNENLLICLGIGLISCRVWSSSSKSFQKISAVFTDEVIHRTAHGCYAPLLTLTYVHKYTPIYEHNYYPII